MQAGNGKVVWVAAGSIAGDINELHPLRGGGLAEERDSMDFDL